MIVRHKKTGVVISPVEDIGGDYYLFKSKLSRDTGLEDAVLALPVTDYEPIPEELWEDVTKACEVCEPQSMKSSPVVSEAGVFHEGKRFAYLVCGGSYRLRKVFPNGVPAFIVERKVSE